MNNPIVRKSKEVETCSMFISGILSVCRLCLVLMFSLAGVAAAQDMVSATVLTIEGQVELRRQPANQPLIQKVAFKVDDTLKAGDTIITGKNGRLVLGLSDGSQAVIAPKTTVVIEDLSKSPRTLFNVIKGKTRIQIEKLGGKPNPYRVNTPTAVIAVRGTIFDVMVNDNDTEIFLHEGEVAVTNLQLPNQPVILTAGQTTRVFLQRPPNPPGTFKPGRNDGNFKTRESNGSPADNRRVASGNNRSDSGRSGNRNENSSRPDFGRSGNPADRGSQPDYGKSVPPSSSPKPNEGQRGGGKRP